MVGRMGRSTMGSPLVPGKVGDWRNEEKESTTITRYMVEREESEI